LIGNSNENMVKLMLPDTIKAKFRWQREDGHSPA
jgi:hypothetical protein